MGVGATIFFTVSNHLVYDQRMQRICTSLATAGYRVVLVGRDVDQAPPLEQFPYEQVRLPCRVQQGKLMYAEFNWLLYRYLSQRVKALKQQGIPVAVCAIDLDTILPCLRISKQFGIARAYDAHELFTELVEVKTRPLIARIWRSVEKFAVPQFQSGYTVNQFIADEFQRRYAVNYQVVRNFPIAHNSQNLPPQVLPTLPAGRFLLYQGAVNEGRSFETLIPALLGTTIDLVIAGEGNFMPQLNALIKLHGLEQRVWLLGALKPHTLQALTPLAFAGLTLFTDTGLNQYYSLANRFFDYVRAGIPQICMAYPEYAALCKENSPALLIANTKPETITAAINNLCESHVLVGELRRAAASKANDWCWQKEEGVLLQFWNQIFNR